MPKVHWTQTEFETCLKKGGASGVPSGFAWQLQFLPLYYGEPDDEVYVSALPEATWFKQLPFSPLPALKTAGDPLFASELEVWGHEEGALRFAEQKQLQYTHPDFEKVRAFQKKSFAFELAPQLPQAALIHNQEEFDQWISRQEGTVVLKEELGFSGKGHRIGPVADFKGLKWIEGQVKVAEPWLARDYDFSTQWQITQAGKLKYLGVTELRCFPKGGYRGTKTFESDEQFPYPVALEEHKREAERVLEEVAREGYFGFVGVDAFIYEKNKCHALVELNMRKTLGSFALLFSKKHFQGRSIEIELSKKGEGEGVPLLPEQVSGKAAEPLPWNLLMKG